jgi:hypothetical protein
VKAGCSRQREMQATVGFKAIDQGTGKLYLHRKFSMI